MKAANNAGGESGAENRGLVLTIGHSARSLEDFIALLREHDVTHLVDVRRFPHSRHNPQYNMETLPDALRAAGIGYTWLEALGGRRRARPDSVNTGWRNSSFRGYADYMETPEFAAALKTLMKLAADERVTLMCAEVVPWRCHRSLIADALLVRGFLVEDIIDAGEARTHKLTAFARVRGVEITYPPSGEE
jgi:uncharacterized protein (DUF488 family)